MQRAVISWSVWAAILVAGSGPAWSQDEGRPLAPGVLTVIPPDPQVDETFTGPMPLVELAVGRPDVQWTPNFSPLSRTVFESAQRIVLRRDVWYLEFAFKPLGIIDVDIPQVSGKMQRKSIWYLIYRVRYRGEDLGPSGEQDDFGHTTFKPMEGARQERYFFPMFLLESMEFKKVYLDRLIPMAVSAIAEREKPDGPLLSSVEITQRGIPFNADPEDKGVWGVAMWEDIDPKMDYFAVYVGGLTNAYKPVDVPGGFKAGDKPGTGRDFLSKYLRLNFWRPGDELHEHENEVRFGIPVDPDPEKQAKILSVYGLRERLDSTWLYR